MDLRLLIVFSIILSRIGTLVKSSIFRVNLRESKGWYPNLRETYAWYPIQVNSSTQGCGQDEKAGMLIGNVFIIYSVWKGHVSQCSTVSTPTMANLSNTNERQLVEYIRTTCNGLRSCHLGKKRLELKKQCGNFCDCLAIYYDIYYSCHPVVPDTKIIFDMSKDFNTTFDTHTAALNVYLVLQKQDIYGRTCCIKANNISINFRLMNTPSTLGVWYNGATEILEDRHYNLSKRFYGVDRLCFRQKYYNEQPIWFHLTDASANQVFTISCQGRKSDIPYISPLHDFTYFELLAPLLFPAAVPVLGLIAYHIVLCCRNSSFYRRQNVLSKKHLNKSQLPTEYVNIDLNGEVDETGVDKITDRNIVSETKPNNKGYSSEYDVYNVIQPTDLSDKPAAEDMVGQRSSPAETYAPICKRPTDNEINVPGSSCRVIGQVGESTLYDVYSTPNKVKKNKDVVAPPTRVNQYSHLSHLRQGQNDLSNTYDG